MNQWTVVLLRLTIVVLVCPVVFVAIFSACRAASVLVHGAVSQAGRAGQLVEWSFFVIAVTASVGGGVMACRELWRRAS